MESFRVFSKLKFKNIKMALKKKLDDSEVNAILNVLKIRLEERFPKLKWQKLQSLLQQNPDKLWSLVQMEKTGGEPNLFEYNADSDEYIFCDFSKESPKDRRSLCYDKEALESRKKFKPKGNAVDTALNLGLELMDEIQYKKLQSFGSFDAKTSSWLKTPEEIRNLGGALFGDFRFGRVFIYHNGAESYYAARGFRGILKIHSGP